METSFKNIGYYFVLLIPLMIAGFISLYINYFPFFNDRIYMFHWSVGGQILFSFFILAKRIYNGKASRNIQPY